MDDCIRCLSMIQWSGVFVEGAGVENKVPSRTTWHLLGRM